jgi:hypothetical protein
LGRDDIDSDAGGAVDPAEVEEELQKGKAVK